MMPDKRRRIFGAGDWTLLWIALLCLLGLPNHSSSEATDRTVVTLAPNYFSLISTQKTSERLCNYTVHTGGISHLNQCGSDLEFEYAEDSFIVDVTFMYDTKTSEQNNRGSDPAVRKQLQSSISTTEQMRIFKAISHVIMEHLQSSLLNKSSWSSLQLPLLHLRSSVDSISNLTSNFETDDLLVAFQEAFALLGEMNFHVSNGVCEMVNTNANQSETQTIRSRVKDIVSELHSAEDILLDSLISRHSPSDPQITIRTNYMEVTITKLLYETGRSGVIANSFTPHLVEEFIVPEAILTWHGGVITAKTKTMRHNPYTWENTGCILNSTTKSLELIDGNNEEILVQDTDQPFVILFHRNDSEKSSRHSIIKSVSNFDIPPKMAAMSIQFSTPKDLFCYEIYLHGGHTLSKDKIDFIFFELWNAHDALANLKRDKKTKKRKPEIDVRYLLSSHGVELDEITCPSHAIRKEPVEKHSAYIESHSCLFWNEAEDSWRHDGCWVNPASNSDTTVCMCNHLTTFAVVIVPVNTINFQHAFSQDLSDNSMVFSCIVVLLSAYLVAVIIMRRSDRNDHLKWAAHPMVDNKEYNTYYYTLSVYTGHAKGSTCRSRVAFDLTGDDGYTEGRLLQDTKNFLKLDSGSLNHYLMNTPISLGHLKYLTIWHDNTGEASHASWFLYWIVVCDLQTNRRYAFVCDRWLALDRDDGKIIRNLKAADESETVSVQADFFRILRETLSDDNLWMSLLNRPTPSNFNRVQRLSVCLALAFLYMICNAMFYGKAETEENVNTINVLGLVLINYQAIYVATITSLIMIPANLLVVMLFRKARPRKGPAKGNLTDMTEVFQEIAPKQTKGIPWWTVYIGWSILFLAVFLSAFFTVLYTLDWGKEKADDWFISMLTAFLESILILEPLKAIVAAALVLTTVKIAKKAADFSNVDPDRLFKVEIEEKKTSTMNIPLDDEPRIRPPDEAYIRAVKKRSIKSANTQEIVHMIFSHIFFILVTLAIIVLYRDYYTFWTTKAINDMFTKSKPYYHLIKAPEEVYNWSTTVAVPNIFPTNYYNYDYKTKTDRRFMEGNAGFRVGPVRLRQKRIMRDTCLIHPQGVPIGRECNDEFDKKLEEKESFKESWSGITDDPCPMSEEDATCPWKFQPAVNTGTSTIFGYNGISYDDGGYIADLGTRNRNAREVLDYLERTHWMDRYTRFMVLEWVIYNANLNHFSFVSFYIEFPETNGAYPYYETHTFRLYDYSSDGEVKAVVVTLLHIFYIMWLIHTCFEEFENIKKAGKSYVKSIDNCTELAVIVVSFLGVIIYMVRKMAVIDLKEELLASKYPQALFQNISFLDKTYAYVMSGVAFMGMVKVNLLLAFDYRFTQMTRTLKLASKPIAYFTLVFSLVFFGFVSLNYLCMGADTKDYHSLLAASESLITTLLGKFRFSNFERGSGRELGMAIFSFYCVVQGFILLTMFMSIIIDAFSEIKRHDDTLKDAIVLEQVCWQEFVRVVEGNLPDEMQIWKDKEKDTRSPLEMQVTVSTDDIKIKDRPPDKYDLDWRIKKIEDVIRSLDGAVQKLCNKVEQLENLDDGQNKL